MSGISGFPSSQKVPLGTGITNNFATVIPTDPYRNALEVPRFAFRVNSATVPRTAGGSTGIELSSDGSRIFWVYDTATPAKVGDFVRFETGSAVNLEIPIVKTDTNKFALAINSGLLPASGDTFYIMRYATQRVDDTGSQLVSLAPGPIAFVLNGVDTEVEQDTGTPANSRPLPVRQLNADGTTFDPIQTQVLVGSLTETAPANDTASSGLNGRLQRIAQRLSSLIALFPVSIGQKNKAGSLSVTLPSDLDPLVVRSGLVPTEYDEIVLTYVGVGLDGEGQVATAVYKLATVTVATLTLSYNANDQLVGVVRS